MTKKTAETPIGRPGERDGPPFIQPKSHYSLHRNHTSNSSDFPTSEPISHLTLVGLLLAEPSSHFTFQAGRSGHLQPTESALYWPIPGSSR